jgi:hypothetical protein
MERDRLNLDLRFRTGCARNLHDLFLVIPAGFKPEARLRRVNLLFILRQLDRAGFPHVTVALQDLPGADMLGEIIRATFDGRIKVVNVRVGKHQYWKARQINEAAKSIPAGGYLFQLDADILPPIRELVKAWKKLGRRQVVDFVKPWGEFVRLDLPETLDFMERFRHKGVVRKHDVVDMICAGGFIIHKGLFEQLGGMDEQFKDWGWEDVALRAKIMALPRIERFQLNQTAVHLHHENDRPFNPDDIGRIRRDYPNDDVVGNKPVLESVLNASKTAHTHFAVMGMGRNGSHMLRSALQRHDKVFMPDGEPFGPVGEFSQGDPRGCTPTALPSLHPQPRLRERREERAVRGFLVHYDHPVHNRNFSFDYRWLQHRLSDIGFRWIHLYRRDLVRQMASHFLARKMNAYGDTPYQESPVVVERRRPSTISRSTSADCSSSRRTSSTSPASPS